MTVVRITALLLPILLSAPVAASADPFDAALQASAEGRHGEAAAAFHDLATQGDGEAAFNLALLFATGRGVPQNDTEALYWAWRARLAGVRAAPALLDRLWPPPDPARRKVVADRLQADFLPLAEAGDGAAMLRLAAVLAVVREVPDAREAHAWQSIAAALDVPGALAARDATLATFPAGERLKVQDHALALFRGWCDRQTTTRPAPCDVVTAAGPVRAGNG